MFIDAITAADARGPCGGREHSGDGRALAATAVHEFRSARTPRAAGR